jgi:hypothetical protein
LQLAAPDDVEHKARQVVRWLRTRGVPQVSREDIRREALSRSVNAARTDQISGLHDDRGESGVTPQSPLLQHPAGDMAGSNLRL